MPQAALVDQPEPPSAKASSEIRKTAISTIIPMSLWSSPQTWVPSRPIPYFHFFQHLLQQSPILHLQRKDVCMMWELVCKKNFFSKLRVHDHVLLLISSNTGKRFLRSLWIPHPHIGQNTNEMSNYCSKYWKQNKSIIPLLFLKYLLNIS